jgi:hypothetical protein
LKQVDNVESERRRIIRGDQSRIAKGDTTQARRRAGEAAALREGVDDLDRRSSAAGPIRDDENGAAGEKILDAINEPDGVQALPLQQTRRKRLRDAADNKNAGFLQASMLVGYLLKKPADTGGIAFVPVTPQHDVERRNIAELCRQPVGGQDLRPTAFAVLSAINVRAR